MKDLTAAEKQELHDEIQEFAFGLSLIGLNCLVIVEGRGVSAYGYLPGQEDDAPEMLASAYRKAKAIRDKAKLN